MQDTPTLYRMNVQLGDKHIRSEHSYTWEQMQEVNKLVLTSAQEALHYDDIVPIPIRTKQPDADEYEEVSPTNANTTARPITKWVFEFNATDTRILQIAAATAIAAAGIGIGIAAVAGVVGLVWG